MTSAQYLIAVAVMFVIGIVAYWITIWQSPKDPIDVAIKIQDRMEKAQPVLLIVSIWILALVCIYWYNTHK